MMQARIPHPHSEDILDALYQLDAMLNMLIATDFPAQPPLTLVNYFCAMSNITSHAINLFDRNVLRDEIEEALKKQYSEDYVPFELTDYV